MPFSKTTDEHTKQYWTEHFKDFLKPLIEENKNLQASRSEPLRGDILRQIITDLVVSRVVVADLTDLNSNVYWELGVRQSFKHGTVTIAEAGTKLPFDVGGKGTLFYYPKDHLKMEDFRKQFRKAMQDCLEHSDRPDSLVLETISGRGTLFETFRRDEAIRRLDAVLSECNRNLEVLDSIIETVKENLKNHENRSYTTDRFRVSAVELLITDRYVDEDQSFFKLADECLNELVPMNDQLNIWEHSVESTEDWLVGQEKTVKKAISSLIANVKSTHEKLSKRF